MTQANLAAPYKMSFAVGGLFLNESIEVVRLRDTSERWETTIVRSIESGIVSAPKIASQRRTLREIVNRLCTLSQTEIELLSATPDRSEQQALLWLATCRAYRFVKEFAHDVIRDRFLSYHLDLPLESFDIFFDAKAEWDEALGRISSSTRKKLRQVLFRIMRDAEVITADNRIQKAYLSPRLQALIAEHDPKELELFPGRTAGVGA